MKKFFYKNLFSLVLPAFLFLLCIILCGIFSTSEFERHARLDVVQKRQATLRTLKVFLEGKIMEIERVASLLASSPSVKSAAQNPQDPAAEDILNKTVDRYAGAYHKEVAAYIMDQNGGMLASSNRHEQDGVAENFYAGHPYFQEAMQGKNSFHFFIDPTNQKRGFYASAPVVDGQGVVKAVVVVKQDLDFFEDFLMKFHHVFVADRNDVIFLSSFPELLFKSLFPLSQERYTLIKESRQYAGHDVEPLFKWDCREGEKVVLFGQEMLYFFNVIPRQEWRIVALGSLDPVRRYRLVGAGLTAVASLIIIIVFIFIFLKQWSLERIQNQRDQAYLFFDLVPGAVFTIDSDNRITRWNHKAEEITGYSAGDVIGEKWDFFLKKEREDKEGRYDFNDANPDCAQECVIVCKDGEERIILKHEDVMRDRDGNIIGGIQSFEDIAEYKALERTLAQSQERYKTAMDVVNEGIWDYKPQTEEFYYSPSWYTVLGYAPYELPVVYKTWQHLVHPEDLPEAEQMLVDFLEGKIKDFYIELRMRHKDGSWKWILSRAKIVERDDSGLVTRVIGTHRDVSDLKIAELKCEEALQVKSKFTSMISRELRSPLEPIKKGLSVVLDGLAGEINEQQRELLGTVRRNAGRLDNLIDEVLDYQKLKAGAVVKFQMKEYDMNAIVREMQASMALMSSSKDIAVNIDLDEAIPLVRFDRDKIIQVLTNFLNNAFKFTEKGSVTIQTLFDGNAVRVAVIDTGSGIRDKDMGRLFESFEQLETAHGRKAGGTGLSLAISKEIIARHGGKVWAESEFGKGSSFYFLLPVKERRKRD